VTRNIRQAFRSLWRAPVFSGVGILTLGLGIGATTAIFSLCFQVLMRELPVNRPEQLVILHRTSGLPGGSRSDSFESVHSYPMYLRLRDSSGSVLQGLIARSGSAVDVMRNGQSERAQAEIVSGNFFQTLGLHPVAGRLLAPADDAVRGEGVAVLGYSYWEKHFGGARAEGEKILINGHPVEIAGVAPPDFRGVHAGQTPDLFLPISMSVVANPGFDALDNPGQHWLTIIGSLRPGISRDQARAALNTFFTAALRDQIPAMKISSSRGRERVLENHLDLRPAASGLNSLERTWKKPLMVLIGVAAGLLLIACSNLATLLMVRSAARQREIAIRRAIGASRWQVVMPLLTESLLLAVMGGLTGLLLSFVVTTGILHILPPDTAGGWVGASFDWRMLAFSLALALVSGMAFGILPAWQVSAESSSSALKDQSRQVSGSGSQTRWRRGLVVTQIALSVILMTTAGLFAKSLTGLLHHDPGFHTENLLTFMIDPGLNRYQNTRALALYEQIRDRLAHTPGVTAVSFCELGPYSNSNASTNVVVDGYHASEDEDMDAGTNAVTPGYFHTLGIPLVAGREFATSDSLTSPKVAVVNEAFVKRFLKGRDPVGVHMSVGAGGPLDISIVGIAPDAQLADLREKPKPFYYVPLLQTAKPEAAARQAVFLVRTQSGNPSLPSAVKALVASLDRTLPVTSMEEIETRVRNSVYQDRALAVLTSASGLVALLLASLGLYGVVAYAVSRRTAEIGIRMALGADRQSIISIVLREVVWMAAAGACLGVAGGLALSRFIASQLFGVQPVDATVFGGSVALLFAVALCAGTIPALRAARIDPVQALRCD
jgi:predicted permease